MVNLSRYSAGSPRQHGNTAMSKESCLDKIRILPSGSRPRTYRELYFIRHIVPEMKHSTNIKFMARNLQTREMLDI